MRKSELERRLEIFLVGQRVDRFEISESAAGDLHVELTDTPINERFIVRLERRLLDTRSDHFRSSAFVAMFSLSVLL